MSTTTPFNLTIVLPPNRQYYVSYFYPYEFHNNSINTCKYKSNVTTVLEEGWHTADIYNEFWKDNPTRGEPITGNIYRVPFIFDYNVQFQFEACTYFIFSWYEGNELKYFVYAIDKDGGHTESGAGSSFDYRQYIVTDEYGSLLVYVGFLNDYAMQVYAPGRKICNYTLGVNDALFRVSSCDKGASPINQNTFPYNELVNGYYVVTYPESVIAGTYQLQDGRNAGYKIPELTDGTLKHGLGQMDTWIVQSNTYAHNDDYKGNYITIYRFKFTTTNNDDNSIKTLYRIMHFSSTSDDNGDLNNWGDLFIDPETKELKIWSWVINPEQRVLKQLSNDTLDIWHELVIPWETYGDLKGFYFDGEYIDLVEICGRTLSASFRKSNIAGFPEIDDYPSRVHKNVPILLDYAALHINSSAYPYVMEDNYFNYYDPILPDVPEPEPEPEKPTGIINKGIYLVCYKGATSIFDKLIRIIKTNLTSKEFPSPPIDPRLRHLVGRLPPPLKGTVIPPLAKPEHILNALPKSYPIHMSPRPIEVLLSKILNSDYTHVGLWIVPENTPIPEEITYYACREDAGVMEYTEAYTDVDLYKINMPTVKPYHVEKFFEKTRYMHGSMIGDMGYRHLMHEHSMSSVEWVAAALNLAFPCKYTINKLIDFANLEE